MSLKSKRPKTGNEEINLTAVPGKAIAIVPEVCTGAHNPPADDPVGSYASRIARGWQETVRTILEVARVCADADRDMPSHLRQEFYRRLPFDRTVFSKLASIGRSPTLHNPEVEASLPPNYSILNIARRLTAKELDRAIAKKMITPDTKRADLERWMSNPNNCRYQAVLREDSGAAISNAAEHDKKVVLLVETWKASPALVEQWRRAPKAVRERFIQGIRKF
jgi:hypothetical protein